MNQLEKGLFIKLFNRDGFVLDFSTPNFDGFTMASIGVALCNKYHLSKGKSLIAFINSASDEDAYKLLADLMIYYEEQYHLFNEETSDVELLFGDYCSSRGMYRELYLQCKDVLKRYEGADANSVVGLEIKEKINSSYISQQIKSMLSIQNENPTDAIGKAKELVESVCKTILICKGETIEKNIEFNPLVNKTISVLKLMPKDILDTHPVADNLKHILGQLKGISAEIAPIRNAFGSGHGKDASFKGLEARHARLLVGCSITLVDFLWSSYKVAESDYPSDVLF